jgi:hypothetical protein
MSKRQDECSRIFAEALALQLTASSEALQHALDGVSSFWAKTHRMLHEGLLQERQGVAQLLCTQRDAFSRHVVHPAVLSLSEDTKAW